MSLRLARSPRLIIGALTALALIGCDNHSPAQANASAPSATPARTAKMNTPSADNFSRSLKIIRLILDDVEANFDGEAGGGVTRIVSEATNTFVVALAKEERTVLYTYTIENGPDGQPRIAAKNESVKSRGG